MNTRIAATGGVRTRSRVLDYLELAKPELTSLSVLTALCGYYLATSGRFDLFGFSHTALGTALLGGGAGALNQYIERSYDGLMRRTERRPIPAGRISPLEGLLFGIITSAAGLVELTLFTNVLTGALGLITFGTYVLLYTPLKRVTPFATIVGGIPGALPPMMGWTAVRNELSLEAWVLFMILFCWQIPHFLSLAWMYRRDYARAGFKMLAVVDERGTRTARHILLYCGALMPASFFATAAGMSGMFYLIGAAISGLAFFAFCVRFARSVSSLDRLDLQAGNTYSRKIFFASLVYLPALLLLMTIDKA